MQLYYLLGQKTLRRNLQYRAAHIIDNLGSAVFGFVLIFIWRSAAGQAGGIGEYSMEDLVLWMAFTQALFQFCILTAPGLNIGISIRNGDVSIEMLRPVHYFAYVMSREAGQHIYNLIYRSIPIYLIFAFTVDYRIPSFPATVLLVASLVIALYTTLCLGYLVGMTAFWTTDIRWSHQLLNTLVFTVSGLQIPVDLLPGFLGRILLYSPLASLAHYPSRVYLELQGSSALLVPAVWALLLTLACNVVTTRARRRLEVQGG